MPAKRPADPQLEKILDMMGGFELLIVPKGKYTAIRIRRIPNGSAPDTAKQEATPGPGRPGEAVAPQEDAAGEAGGAAAASGEHDAGLDNAVEAEAQDIELTIAGYHSTNLLRNFMGSPGTREFLRRLRVHNPGRYQEIIDQADARQDEIEQSIARKGSQPKRPGKNAYAERRGS